MEGMIWCLVCYDDDADGQEYKQSRDKTELHHQREERVSNWLDRCGGGGGEESQGAATRSC